MPGRAGNWGGSYLAIPKMSQHKKEAYDLVQWLTAPEQQAKLFQRIGNFPSSVPAIEKVADTKDPYFSGARSVRSSAAPPSRRRCRSSA